MLPAEPRGGVQPTARPQAESRWAFPGAHPSPPPAPTVHPRGAQGDASWTASGQRVNRKAAGGCEMLAAASRHRTPARGQGHRGPPPHEALPRTGSLRLSAEPGRSPGSDAQSEPARILPESNSTRDTGLVPPGPGMTTCAAGVRGALRFEPLLADPGQLTCARAQPLHVTWRAAGLPPRAPPLPPGWAEAFPRGGRRDGRADSSLLLVDRGQLGRSDGFSS